MYSSNTYPSRTALSSSPYSSPSPLSSPNTSPSPPSSSPPSPSNVLSRSPPVIYEHYQLTSAVHPKPTRPALASYSAPTPTTTTTPNTLSQQGQGASLSPHSAPGKPENNFVTKWKYKQDKPQQRKVSKKPRIARTTYYFPLLSTAINTANPLAPQQPDQVERRRGGSGSGSNSPSSDIDLPVKHEPMEVTKAECDVVSASSPPKLAPAAPTTPTSTIPPPQHKVEVPKVRKPNNIQTLNSLATVRINTSNPSSPRNTHTNPSSPRTTLSNPSSPHTTLSNPSSPRNPLTNPNPNPASPRNTYLTGTTVLHYSPAPQMQQPPLQQLQQLHKSEDHLYNNYRSPMNYLSTTYPTTIDYTQYSTISLEEAAATLTLTPLSSSPSSISSSPGNDLSLFYPIDNDSLLALEDEDLALSYSTNSPMQ